MNIISNNYEKVLKEMIFNQFSSNLKKELNKITSNNVFTYVDLISNIDQALCDIARNNLVVIFETIDKSYSNSIERKHKYHIKAHHSRTILTIFGEITFNRTYYSFKDGTGSFCYLDRYLGLKKHDYFDPYIKSLVVEYAANNSVPTVCNMVNELIGNRIKLNGKIKFLIRQTARNIILDSKLSNPPKKELETPETIYIIADEKFVSTQNNDGEKVMVKSMVTFDCIKEKPRRNLNNKRIFASFKNNKFLDEALDYLYYTYDIDKIKNIFVMGDGAKWIKNLTSYFRFNKDINIVFALDKFHFRQAIHHICLNKDLEEIVSDYITNDKKEYFIELCNTLIESFPYRIDTLEKKKEYILNNWNYILNLHKYDLSCPMESQISHNLAYLLSSRPKGYSLKMLKKILKIRLLFRNNENIKLLYLNNYNKQEIQNYEETTLNFDIFDTQKSIDKYTNRGTGLIHGMDYKTYDIKYRFI